MRRLVPLLLLAVTALFAFTLRVDVVSHLPPGLDAIHRDAEERPFLHAGDPFYHLRQSRAILERGAVGTRTVDGRPWDDLSFAPAGRPVRSNLLHPLQAGLVRLSGSRLAPMSVVYYLPAVLAALLVVFVFILGRRLGGVGCGLAAALLAAIHPELVSHTHAGMADTTSLSLLLLTGSLTLVPPLGDALLARRPAAAAGWSAALGLVLLAFRATWVGWVAAAGLAALGLLLWGLMKPPESRQAGRTRGPLIALGAVLAAGAGGIALSVAGKFGRYSGVEVDESFPLGTDQVLELAGLAPTEVLSRLSWPLALAALAGLAAALPRRAGPARPLAATLGLWLLPAAVAGTLAMRFLVLAVPPLALLAAYGGSSLLGRLGPRPRLRIAIAVTTLAGVGTTFMPRYEVFRQRTPVVDQAVMMAADAIERASPANAIVNLWWDHGYLYSALANRPVILDGGSFQSRRLYWISRALTTHDPTLARQILRLIDCGAEETVYDAVRLDTPSAERAITTLHHALRREDARRRIETLLGNGLTGETASVVERALSCRPPKAWWVVSSDLLAKTTSWAHYGSWDFSSTAEARPSGPGDITATSACQLIGSQLECRNGFRADLSDPRWSDRSMPGHFAYRGPVRLDGLVPVVYQQGRGLRMVYVTRELADSLFARLYFENGRGLEHFRLHHESNLPETDKRVLVYEVLWD
ncbi:MAG: STT3 domain-containing protein [Acidobacteriota bacterium]